VLLRVGGDPGGEDVVGVVGKMVTDEGVEQVLLAAQPGVRERDQLAVPGITGNPDGARQQVAGLHGHERSGDE
jgi:hypothetical protein